MKGKLRRCFWTPVCAISAVLLAGGVTRPEIDEFLVRIQDSDAEARCAAWREAGPMGAEAIASLADLMAGGDQGVSLAAVEALHRITHHAARPEATPAERHGVADELAKLLDPRRPNKVRAESLYLLSLIGDEDAVKAIAALLDDRELRDTARMTLQRIPGSACTQALIAALDKAPTDFAPLIIAALGQRGDPAAVKPLMKTLETPDIAVGDAAFNALARIGEPAGDTFTPDTITKLSDDGLGRLTDAYLRYAEKRAAKGDLATATAIYEALIQRVGLEHQQLAAKIGLDRTNASASSRPGDATRDLSK